MPQVINQRYRIEHRYLSVSVGVVYRAYDLRDFRPVMIWTLPKASAYRRRLLVNDVEAIAELGRDDILELYGHDIDAKTGQLFLVSKFLDCRTLGGMLSECFPHQPLPRELALRIAIQTLSAVQAAHQKGVVHRRISPYTIFLWRNNVKLAGFGLAYLQELGSVSAQEAFYLAPEQLVGELGYERADLYSIGVVAFQIFTGELPFYGVNPEDLRQHIEASRPTSPSALNPQVPKNVEAVILKLLQKDPSLRYQTAGQVLDELNV